MEKQKNESQIAIIGATQSGKTTLAAGLAKTSSPEFTVGFANQATSDYFQPRIAGIAAGHWPEGNIGEDKDLGLKINTPGGRSALISFKEYMGERMNDENYLEHIVGKPNGALILLSPGMGLLTDHMKREKLIGNLKGIVDYLKSNKCVAIAFVVTACDRLKTDLKDFAEEFGNYVAEVTNYLNTSGMDWKRFDVTITGELVDQQKPSIAVGDKNTARGPFVWIMDRVAGRKHMMVAKRTCGALGILAIAGLAVFGAIRGGRYYSEWSELKVFEKTVAEIENKIESATKDESESGLKSATDELAERIKTNKARPCRFLCCETRRTNDLAKWSKTYDDARVRYFSVSMDKRKESLKTRGAEDECAKFDKWLAEFAPTDLAKKTALTNRWAQLRPKIREGYDVECGNAFSGRLEALRQKEKDKGLLTKVQNFKDEVSKWETEFVPSQNIRTNVLHGADELIQRIEDELDLRVGNDLQNQIDDMAKNAATKATVDELEQLRQNVDGWEPYTDKGKTRKREIRKNLVDNKPRWEQVYLDNCCTTNAEAIVRKIRGLNPNDSSLHSDDICNTLKTAYGFTNEWTKASTNVLSVATNKICEVSSKFLFDFLTSFTNKWDVCGRRKPEISNDDKSFIEAALDLPNPNKPSEKLSGCFLKELEEARSDAEKRWFEQQKKFVDDYIAIVKNMSAVYMFDSSRKDSYRNWYEKNCGNPFVTNVDFVVEQTVSKFFDDYIQEFWKVFYVEGSVFKSDAGKTNARDRFMQFKNLCLALSKDPCGLEKKWCFDFARKCRDVGHIDKGMDKAFSRKFHIADLEVKLHIEDSDYRDHMRKLRILQCRLECDGDEPDEAIADGEFSDEDFHSVGKDIYLSTNPWSIQLIGIFGEIVNTFHANDNISEWFWLSPYDEDYRKTGHFEFSFRQSSGTEILDWYVCTVHVSGAFEGTDIFELYRECRSGK